jgi:hypothetical protein
MLKNERAYPSPSGKSLDFTADVAEGGNPLEGSRISCLSLSADDGFGLIALGKV